MNWEVVRTDITTLKIEAIVNASNTSGLGCTIPNHCIDSAIHRAAGPELLSECIGLNGIPTGIAKTTYGYRLPCNYIIHVTGPRHLHGEPYDYAMLQQCYAAVLDEVKRLGIKEIAFCCISTGLFAYPKRESAEIAVRSVQKWCVANHNYKLDRIVFCTFTDTDEDLYNEICFA